MKRFVIFVLPILALMVAACATPTSAPTHTPAPNQVAPSAPTVAPTASATATLTPEATRTPTPTPSATPEAKPIKIGVLSDQTGTLALYAPLIENGFALGLDFATDGKNNVAGRALQVIVKDTASKPEIGVQVARDLIEKENVDVLIGVPSAGVALAIADLAKQYRKIYIAQPTFVNDLSAKNFNPYVFRTSRTSVQDLSASGIAFRMMGRSLIHVASENQMGIAQAAAYYAMVKTHGGYFVMNDNSDRRGAILIPQEAKDFTPLLQKVVESGADGVIVTWAGAGFVPLFTQMQQVGIFKTMKVFTNFGDNQTIKAGYGSVIGATGIIPYHYTLPKNSVNDWLALKSKEKFSTPPDVYVESSFTAAQMLVAALKATNGNANADVLIPVLEKLSFDGPKGKYTVRDYDHVLLQPLYYVKLKNNDDPDFKFFDLIYELKPEETAPPCFLEGEYKSRCR